MVFNSYIFIFAFLPLCLAGWYILNLCGKFKAASVWLVLMSLIFCGYINAAYTLVLAISIAVNYGLYLLISKSEGTARRAALVVGLVINIAALLYLKYCNFFIENINAIFKADINVVKLFLPLGISFYTFHQISFLVDTYRREIRECNIIDYSLYIAYFPKLSMGPIVRYNDMAEQFSDMLRRRIDWDNVAKGIYIFTLGLAKKVLIADTFATAVNLGYQNIGNLNSIEAAFIILAYTVQIYFDFSGYCDMALGIGKMMNIDLPINFNSPYKSKTIVEFWDRWHITLTKFFTRYLYIPLGGNRKGTLRTYVNTMIVFLFSGFWHGANWTFVLWGGLHGLFTVLTKACKKTVEKIPDAINWLITLAFVNVAWVFFRAPTIPDALLLLKRVFAFDFGNFSTGIWGGFRLPELQMVIDALGLGSFSFSRYLFLAIFVVVTALLLIFKNANEKMNSFKPTAVKSIVTVVLLAWCVLSFTGVTTFVYMNF